MFFFASSSCGQFHSSWFHGFSRWSLWLSPIPCTFWDGILSSIVILYHMPFRNYSMSSLDFFFWFWSCWGSVDQCSIGLLCLVSPCSILSVLQWTLCGVLTTKKAPLFCAVSIFHIIGWHVMGLRLFWRFLWGGFSGSIPLVIHSGTSVSYKHLFYVIASLSWMEVIFSNQNLCMSSSLRVFQFAIFFSMLLRGNPCIFLPSVLLRVLITNFPNCLSIRFFSYVLLGATFSSKIVAFPSLHAFTPTRW